MISLYVPLASAEIKLYACTQDGVSLLQDKPIENCEDLQVFTYQSVYKGDKKATLRASEEAFFKPEQLSRELDEKRYMQVDETVGGALSVREIDRRRDECYFFKGRIKNTLVRIERRPADHLEVRELVAQLALDANQHQYYCGKAYPNLTRILERDLRY